MNRILVTGGAGFIGSNLVRQLQEDEPQAVILVIDDLRVGDWSNLCSEDASGWSFRGQIIPRALNDLDLFGVIEDFDPEVVFHLASITDTTVADQNKMLVDNVEPFEVLLDAAAELGIKLVWASSAATYGTHANGAVQQRRPFRLDDAGRPANIYGFSKWVMENMARQTLADSPESHVVGLRYFNVFGPGEQSKGRMASMIYQLAQQMLDGKRPRIFNPGEHARDHVHVRDVVGATLAAAGDKVRMGTYNVGTGKATNFNEVVAALNEALGTSLEPDYFENPFKFYQDYTCADLSQTRSGLRWSPKVETRAGILEYARQLASKPRNAAAQG
ncbi:MAG: NAD-dependent epimerase/dehydratase family protein [Planctomycetota bacterium]|nr:NAD-dependent epimerase/dehydratase family protein [Planctomycetota bacterium]